MAAKDYIERKEKYVERLAKDFDVEISRQRVKIADEYGLDLSEPQKKEGIKRIYDLSFKKTYIEALGINHDPQKSQTKGYDPEFGASVFDMLFQEHSGLSMRLCEKIFDKQDLGLELLVSLKSKAMGNLANRAITIGISQAYDNDRKGLADYLKLDEKGMTLEQAIQKYQELKNPKTND